MYYKKNPSYLENFVKISSYPLRICFLLGAKASCQVCTDDSLWTWMVYYTGPLFRMTDPPRPRTSGRSCRRGPASLRTSSACWGRRWSFSTQSWRTRWPELSLKYLCSKHNSKHWNLTLKQCRTVKVQSVCVSPSLVVRVSFRRGAQSEFQFCGTCFLILQPDLKVLRLTCFWARKLVQNWLMRYNCMTWMLLNWNDKKCNHISIKIYFERLIGYFESHVRLSMTWLWCVQYTNIAVVMLSNTKSQTATLFSALPCLRYCLPQ